MEEQLYYCQNWRGDVSAIVTGTGQMKEWVKYSAYGVPFGIPGGDANSDGDCDAGDVGQVETWVEQGPYDVRGDVNLDGNVDEDDLDAMQTTYQGIALGRGVLSSAVTLNRMGFRGYERNVDGSYSVGTTTYSANTGRRSGRIAIGHNLYQSSTQAANGWSDNAITIGDQNPVTCEGSKGPGNGCEGYGDAEFCVPLPIGNAGVVGSQFCWSFLAACWKLECVCNYAPSSKLLDCVRACEQDNYKNNLGAINACSNEACKWAIIGKTAAECWLCCSKKFPMDVPSLGKVPPIWGKCSYVKQVTVCVPITPQ
jgi:hypothetical protein